MINLAAVLRQIDEDYVRDFEAIFHISGTGALRCRNDDIPAFNDFIKKWTALFLRNEILLGHLVLVPAGHRDIETVNDNKVKILRLYGVAFHLYLKTIRHLDRQPRPEYADIVVVKFEE